MVQLSQTSWLEFSLPNVLETLQYAPLNLTLKTDPILYYTLPKEMVPGACIKYTIQNGFRAIKWTGIISSVSDNKITVRLGEGPFRGFTANHLFESENILTTCHDDMSFQGFTTIPEETFSSIIDKINIIYGIPARKDTRNVMLSLESQKKTQSFEALDQSATAG